MKTTLRYFLVAIAPVWAQTAVSPTMNGLPTKEFGQASLQSSLSSVAPNLVEGRELYSPYGVAFDTSVSPAILYVADTNNNRVLAWKNPASLGVCGLANPTCGFATMAIGQRDLVSTLAGGPGNPGLTAGFNSPTSIAVDSNGNLYVTDTGNNRILRFPAPFKQTGALLQADLVIGQPSIASGNQGNQGLQLPTAQTLNLAGDQFGRSGITIEPATGALWVTDPNNNRVLRFPSTQLAPNTSQPTADLVLGQSNFISNTIPTAPPNTPAQLYPNSLFIPVGLAFDQSGNLYVADNYSRILFYSPPFSINLAANRLLGIPVPNGVTPLTLPNQYSVQNPGGLFTINNHLFVADSAENRIVEYDVPGNWPAPGNPAQGQQISPPIIAVIGQNDMVSGKANKGQGPPTNSSLNVPFGAAFNGTDLWVADTGNNRVLDFPVLGGIYTTASRLAGQLNYAYNAPNLIEGREVFFGVGNGGLAGFAVDHNSNPPHLYIADTFNNRILCFKDYRNVQQNGQQNTMVDIVLGQPDVYTSLANSGVSNQTTQQGLFQPIGLVVDANGNLFVADSGNGRVLRFPAPFNQPPGVQQTPNLVLGQSSFTGTPITDVSVQNMHTPYGLVLFQGCFMSNHSCSLAVSDAFHNRVLIFTAAAGTDFQNGQSAVVVLGQQGFNNQSASSATNGLNSPRHMSADSSDRLYVCDSGNNRLLIFAQGPQSVVGQGSSLQVPNLNSPQGVVVSQITGEAWVTSTGNDQVVRFPSFENLILSQTPNDTIQLQTNTLAVTLDNADNPIVAEAANRVTFFFPEVVWQNSANYNSQPMAPGMLALLYRVGLNFNFTSTPSQAAPLQTTLNDIQIQVNGVPAPIFRIDNIDLAFQVPQGTPLTNVPVVVLHPSTGEVLGSNTIPIQQFSPGFYTSGIPAGTGLAAAVNDDNTVNTASNPVSRDGTHFIQFYMTGGGAFPGVPDGQIPSSAVNTQVRPIVLAAAFAPNGIAPDSDVLYSGTSFYPGVWQVNFKVETKFGPGQNVIAMELGSYNTTLGPSGQIQVYFYTK